jgi:predicted AAA+ superfamily ATPase
VIETQIESNIGDFRELGVPELITREDPLNMAREMVSAVIGARRAGKSYRALQAAKEMVSAGTMPSLNHVCPIDFDNPHLSTLRATELSVIQRTFLKMNPDFGLRTPVVFILDEIHKIGGWEEYVVDLSRNPNWKVIVTGSSSRMLRTDIATELRGKSISSMVYPLSFREFLRFKGLDTVPESTTGQAQAIRLFEEYLQWGAYPAVCTADNKVKEPLLREYFDVMILRDIVQRYDVSQPSACTAVLRHLLSNIAKPFTIQSCLAFTQGSGFKLARDTVANWVDWAQDSWLLFAVPIFSASAKAQGRNYRKAYSIDWALANCNSLVWDGGYSRALENMVFLHLHRHWPRVQYYLTRDKRQEIDFVCVDNRGTVRSLVQVCEDLSDAQTARRELEPLAESGRYFGCKDCIVVTRGEQRLTEQDGVGIRVVPAWRWLLEAQG